MTRNKALFVLFLVLIIHILSVTEALNEPELNLGSDLLIAGYIGLDLGCIFCVFFIGD